MSDLLKDVSDTALWVAPPHKKFIAYVALEPKATPELALVRSQSVGNQFA